MRVEDVFIPSTHIWNMTGRQFDDEEKLPSAYRNLLKGLRTEFGAVRCGIDSVDGSHQVFFTAHSGKRVNIRLETLDQPGVTASQWFANLIAEIGFKPD